jgi:hypothetical protein
MVTNAIEALRLGLPVDRQQRTQVVLICHRREPSEHVFEVSQRILAVPLAGDDQRVQDCGTLAGLGMRPEGVKALFVG